MPAATAISAKDTTSPRFPLLELGGQLNVLDALVEGIVRAEFLGTVPPTQDAAERVNYLLMLCQQEVKRAVELCQLCEEHYSDQQ